MDFSLTCSVQHGAVTAEILCPEADEFTRYACYLLDEKKNTLQKQMYQKEQVFTFPVQPGIYYVKAFVRSRPNQCPDSVTDKRESKRVTVYPTVALDYGSLEQVDFQGKQLTIYAIQWSGVTFEFAIRCPAGAKTAVVVGSGDIGQQASRPAFSRISWAGKLPGCAIYYFDPTVYAGKSTLCWGYGTNQRWYLENIAVLVKKILDRLGISLADTLFFGSSGGGYMSILLASMLHGRATAINPQFLLEKWVPKNVRSFRESVLEPEEELIPERIDAAKLIQREGFFPPIHVWQNICSAFDVKEQLTPFLCQIAGGTINGYDRLRVNFYSGLDGRDDHNAMPPEADCLRVMAEDLARPEPCLSVKPGSYPPGSLLARLEAGEF